MLLIGARRGCAPAVGTAQQLAQLLWAADVDLTCLMPLAHASCVGWWRAAYFGGCRVGAQHTRGRAGFGIAGFAAACAQQRPTHEQQGHRTGCLLLSSARSPTALTRMTDAELMTRALAKIAATADDYPGVVIVLSHDCRQVLYMSARGLLGLQLTIPELVAMGEDYYARYFNPDEAHEYVPKVVELLERNDLNYSVSFFQQVRTGPGRTFEHYLSTARVLAQGESGGPLLTICLSCRIEPDSH
nr:hypothetical protein [Tanacetum cinerariifolium]